MPLGNVPYLFEYSGFTLYKNNEKSPNSPDTTVRFILYLVNNADGIYNGVTKVFLDASQDQRILYFIGKKHSC